MRFDLVDLKLFLNIVECSSITRGAALSSLALASASGRVRNMELDLGAPLLVREARGVRTTQAGLALADHARLILDQHQRMCGEMMNFGGGVRGSFRLLSNTAALAQYVPDLLATYLIDHPSVDVEIEERQSHDIVMSLCSGNYDAGIIAGVVETFDLATFPFADDRLVLVTASDHIFAGKRSISFKSLLGLDFIGLMVGSALCEHLDMQASHHSKRIRWRARAPSFDAVCSMVAKDVGIAIVSETAARKASLRYPISLTPLDETWARRKLLLCIRELDALPIHSRLAVEYMREHAPLYAITHDV